MSTRQTSTHSGRFFVHPVHILCTVLFVLLQRALLRSFQELDLRKNAYIFSESPKEAEWVARVEESLHSGTEYAPVHITANLFNWSTMFVNK